MTENFRQKFYSGSGPGLCDLNQGISKINERNFPLQTYNLKSRCFRNLHLETYTFWRTHQSWAHPSNKHLYLSFDQNINPKRSIDWSKQGLSKIENAWKSCAWSRDTVTKSATKRSCASRIIYLPFFIKTLLFKCAGRCHTVIAEVLSDSSLISFEVLVLDVLQGWFSTKLFYLINALTRFKIYVTSNIKKNLSVIHVWVQIAMVIFPVNKYVWRIELL